MAAVLGLVFLRPSGPSVAKNALVIATTNAGIFAVTVQAPGTLQSRETRFVTAPVPGTVAALLIAAIVLLAAWRPAARAASMPVKILLEAG